MRCTKYRLELVKEESCNYTVLKNKLTNPYDVYKILKDVYNLDSQAEEVFMCICLDTKNKIIGFHEISRGTINSSLVHPREVFKRALLNNSNKIMLAHNHPSGEIDPSKEDKNVTKRLESAGEILGIEVLDHIILGDGQYFSFKENGLI